MTTFTDDFNRANGAPGANWVDGTGLWSIVSNQLSSGTAGGTIVIRAATAMATSDNSAQVTIAATGAVSHGVFCRANTGFTQGYLWRNDGTSWALFSNVGGSFASLGSFAGAAVAGDVAKVQAIGSTITGYVNGVARVTVTNTAVTTGTSVGIRAESTNLLRFDDFTAADVASGATGDATRSGSAALSAAGLRATAGGSVLAPAAGLAADGVRAATGATILSSTTSLTADGVRAATGDVSAPWAASLAAGGIQGVSGATGLAVTTAVAADGSVAATANAARTVSAGLVAAGAIGSMSAGSAIVSAGLQASGQVSGVVVRGAARGAVGVGPRGERGEQAGLLARHGDSAVPVARGGVL